MIVEIHTLYLLFLILQRARVAPRLIVGFVAIFLPFTHQKEVEEEKEAIQLVRRAVEGVMEGGNNGGVDITTTKLLAILASMSFFALLWETITGLDGPNAPADCASQDYLNKADDGHTPKAALQTPTWKGEKSVPLSLFTINCLLICSAFPQLFRLPDLVRAWFGNV